MILSDRDIRRRLEVGDIEIDPLDDPDLQLQPASVDLRLGTEFLTFKSSNIPCIRPDRGDEVGRYVERTTIPGTSTKGQQSLRKFEHELDADLEEAQREFILHPGDFVLGTTKERVKIPPDLIAHVEGRSSLGRLAIVVHASLPATEEVFLWTPEDGFGFYEIGDIVEQERPAHAVAFDPTTLRVGTHPITDYLRRPAKRIYRVTLESGRQVEVTRDHNLFTIDDDGGVTRIPSEDAVGRHVMVPEKLPGPRGIEREVDLVSMFSDNDSVRVYASDGGIVADNSDRTFRSHNERDPSVTTSTIGARETGDADMVAPEGVRQYPRSLEVTHELAWIVGIYLTAGSVKQERIRFDHTDRHLLDRIEAWFEGYGVDTEIDDGDSVLVVHSRFWATVLETLVSSDTVETVPDRAWNWQDDILRALLDGILDGGESATTVFTDNEALVDRVMYLATRCGIRASCSRQEIRDEVRADADTNGFEQWAITLNPDRADRVPVPGMLLGSIRAEAGIDCSTADGICSEGELRAVESGECEAMERDTFALLRDAYRDAGADTQRLDQLVDGHIGFEQVRRVEPTDRVEPVYDLEVQPAGRTIENFLGGRGGVFLSNTAGLCDPGYEGQITLELSNLGTAPVALAPDMRIAQLTFTELTSPAERPYGDERGSKYQGQTGPQASRLERDPEFDHSG